MVFEDYTTYTEVDDNNRFTITENKIEVRGLRQNDEEQYVKKSHPNIGDFQYLVKATIISGDNNNGQCGIVGISNTYFQRYDMSSNDDGIICYFRRRYISDAWIYFSDYVADDSDYYQFSFTTTPKTFWITMERTDTTAKVFIYNDEDRTNLLDTLTISCSSDIYSNIIATNGYGLFSATANQIAADIEDLDLQEAEPANIRIWDGSDYIELVQDENSPLKMYNGVEIIGIALVDTGSSDASKIRIYDGATVKALRKL